MQSTCTRLSVETRGGQLQLRPVKCGIDESRRKKEEPVPSRDYETIQKRAIS